MPAPPTANPFPWSLVVPVKVLAHAKTRLAAFAGPDRPALALAMAADTVAAALASPRVGRVIVVTDDARAAEVLAGLGACASTPPATPPAALTPAQFAQAAATESQPVAEFWRAFGDAELDTLINESMAANRDLRVAAARVTEAQALERGTASAGGGYPT